MSKALLTAVGISLAIAGSQAFAQQEPAPRVEITPIKGPLYELRGKGGNVVASVGEDGVLLIDSDYDEYAEAHEAALAALELTPAAPRFLLNTHWHFDHVGGNAFWGEQGTVIMGHENVYARMSTRQEMKAFGMVLDPSPALALPVVTYADQISVHFNGDLIRAQHFPSGHTDGDSIVFFTGQNVVHMGDHMFEAAFPFVDIGSGGNALSLIENLRAVLDLINDETIIVPGHGPGLLGKEDVRGYIEVLSSSAEKVKAGLAAGKSVEEIAAEGLGPEYAGYGSGFIDEATWIGFVAAAM